MFLRDSLKTGLSLWLLTEMSGERRYKLKGTGFKQSLLSHT